MSLPAIAIFLVTCSTTPASTDQGQATSADRAGWIEYRNQQYNLTLRYPPDHAIFQPRDQLQPSPVFRVWFQDARLVKSPIADREPPKLAVDVYDNRAGLPLEAWLSTIPTVSRGTREDRVLGEQRAIRVTSQLLVAPNVFYYVARGPLVFRFTPLGPSGDQMLETVHFTP